MTPDGPAPLVSLVVPTRGRTAEPERLLETIAAQTEPRLEVILADQNDDGRLLPCVERFRSRLAITHLRPPDAGRGASGARNAGIPLAAAPWIAFPDDDGWYPPDLVERALGLLGSRPELDGITFRCLTGDGRPAPDVRWHPHPGPVSRINVWRRGGLAHTFILRTGIARRIGGFDPSLGPPWSAGEDTEFLLRALEAGARLEYRPELHGHHPAPIGGTSPDDRAKARRYGEGIGRVLRRHRYPLWLVARTLGAPATRALLATARRDTDKAALEWALLSGRLRGYRAERPGGGAQAASAPTGTGVS